MSQLHTVCRKYELFHYDDPDVDADVVMVGAISGPKTCPEPGT